MIEFKASSHEDLDLKPYWFSVKKSESSKYLDIFRANSFSNTLAIHGSVEIGLQLLRSDLEPLPLQRGVICAIFHSSGMLFVFNSVGLSTQKFKYLSLSTCKKNTPEYLNFFKYFSSTQKNTQFFSSIFLSTRKILKKKTRKYS